MIDVLRHLAFDYTLRNVALGSALLGIVSGVLGPFAVLRRQGLLGDALAHAALPGICLAFLLTGSKETIVLLAGAALAGWVGALAISLIVRRTTLSEDAALALVLSTFFGLGISLLTLIARRNDATQAGLDKFLFGQAAALVERNVITFAVLGGLTLAVTALCFKEFKLLTFDPAFADSLGFNSGRLNVLLTALIVMAVVIGLQTVGVVLMAAMLIGPAAAARQWTDRLGVTIALAALFGSVSGVVGAMLSFFQRGLPTGPTIVLALTAIVVVSLAFGSARGIVWSWARRRRGRRRLMTAPLPQRLGGGS
ncbi:MAG: metal ABC transporter permease [Thermomicrobiales bacterium]|nr:metal ABC transporter permease [Thermomicrobiales bacterium]